MSTWQEAVAGLIEAVATPPDRNDLGRLASMHTCCQNLGEADGPNGSELRLMGQALGTLLERLILDEAAKPEVGVAAIPVAVEVIGRLHHGEPVDVSAVVAQVNEAAGVTSAPPAPPAPEAQAADPSPTSPAAAPPPAVPEAAAPPSPPEVAPVASEPVAGADPVSQPTSPPPVAEVVSEPGVPSVAPPVAATDAGDVEPYESEPLMLDMGEKEHLQGFLDEATEHMDSIEGALLEVETDPSDTNKINELFRPFHTIKGIAGFLGLRDINYLTHEMETILDLGRKNELKINTAIVDLIFSGVDVLKTQLDAIRAFMAEPAEGPCPQPDITDIMRQLRKAVKGGFTAATATERPKLGEILVGQGAVAESDVESALEAQRCDAPPPRKVGEILVDEGRTTRGEVDSALAQQNSGKPILDTSIRVDTAKLDLLVDAVGELVIAQSMVSLSEVISTDDKLQRNVSQVTKIVRDVQETAMAMRMIQIGHTFQKMRRLVRDVARKAGKQVELSISGEDTELDKNVIQQISDPLVHMVRNAVDHGVETPEQRQAAGKPEVGHVSLDAFHQGDSIVIEIRDDGKGLDADKLIAKGIERGLVSPGEQLSEQQAYALILQPGFSTAEQITDISGRGVGMDVVKRNIERLRGKIEIHSEKGKGSVFSIRLPLTLAIIDGMIVRLGHERLIIPTILIEQSLRPERKQITSVQRRGEMLQVRGELCPLIQLGMLFDYAGVIDPCENLVVIVQCEGQKVALVVEELIGQQQVVIKTLGDRFKQVKGISGAAILGDGRVGLILEPSGLLALHNEMGGGICTADMRRSENVFASLAEATLTQQPETMLSPTEAETQNELNVTDAAEPVPVPV